MPASMRHQAARLAPRSASAKERAPAVAALPAGALLAIALNQIDLVCGRSGGQGYTPTIVVCWEVVSQGQSVLLRPLKQKAPQ